MSSRRLRLFPVACTVVIALLCVTVRAGAASPSAQVLPLSIVDNRAFVGVRIDGQGPFSFLIDTGSTGTTVTPELARRLGLISLLSETGGGAGEGHTSYTVVHVKSASIGAISLGPFDAPAIDLTQLARVVGFQRCDGVLGSEIFQTHVVIIDMAHSRLTIQDPDRFQAPVGAAAISINVESSTSDFPGMPTFVGSVNGIKARFEVDTGDRSSLTLYGPFWRAHRIDRTIGKTVVAMTGYGIGGPIRSIVGRPENFKIGALDIAPPVTRLSLQNSGSFTRSDYAGSVGMGILKHFVVFFDYQRKTMWLLKGADYSEPDRYDRSGLWLGFSGQRGLKVIDVTPQSPAAEAGIAKDDMITKVGNVTAQPNTLFEIRRILQMPDLMDLSIVVEDLSGAHEARLMLRNQIDPSS